MEAIVVLDARIVVMLTISKLASTELTMLSHCTAHKKEPLEEEATCCADQACEIEIAHLREEEMEPQAQSIRGLVYQFEESPWVHIVCHKPMQAQS